MNDREHASEGQWPQWRAPRLRLSYRVEEVAEITGISRATIYRLIATEKLKTVMVGNIRLVSAKAIEELIENGAP